MPKEKSIAAGISRIQRTLFAPFAPRAATSDAVADFSATSQRNFGKIS
jgi:hypothetical protein